MAAGRIIVPNCMPARDINGDPVAGAKLYFYLNNTTTLTTVYTSSALSVAHPNPLTADAAGAFPSIFADDALFFTVAITDSLGAPINGLRNMNDVATAIVYGDDVVEAAEAARDEALQAVVDAEAQVALAADQVALAAAQVALAAAQVALANAERVLAEAAATEAETYKDLVIAALANAAAITGLNEPYESLAIAEGSTIPVGVKAISTRFFAPTYTDMSTLVGGARYVRISLADITALGLTVDALVSERPYFRSADRFMPDGTTDATNGGYWILAPGQIFTPGMFGHNGNDGANGTGTTKIQCLLNYINDIGGGEIWWPKGNGYYYQGRAYIRDNTVIRFEPGTVIQGTPRSLYNAVTAPAEGNNVFRVGGANVELIGYGATMICDTTGWSACLYLEGAENVLIEGIRFEESGTDGSGETKDCVYIGGAGAGTWSENITVRNCEIWHGARNNLAIAAGRHVLVEGCKIYECIGPSGPQAGIDVEANRYDETGHITIRNNRIFGNPKFGISSIFSDHLYIYGNEIYDNLGPGIAISAGGAQFNTNTVRSNVDIRAITAVADTATNELTITGGSTLDVGSFVLLGKRGAGVYPTISPSVSRYMVLSRSADNAKIKLTADGYAEADITTAGSGTLTSDPTTSELYLTCLSQEGQASETHIYNNELYGNTGGLDGQILISTCLGAFVYENHVVTTVSGGIKAQYSKDVQIYKNVITGSLTDTTVASKGVMVEACSYAHIHDNTVRNFYGQGIHLNGSLEPGCLNGNIIENCGRGATAAFSIQQIRRPIIRGGRIRNDLGHPAARGLRCEADVADGLFDGINAAGAGTSNSSSLVLTGSGNKKINCTQWDGTRTSTMTDWATVSTNADFTLLPETSARNTRHTGTLTADRTVTLSTTSATTETEWYIVRTGSGAFNLSVGGLKNLVTSSWCRVRYDGSAYVLVGYGTL